MIDKLRLSTSHSTRKTTVVIDAGIATEENLKLIVEKGYDDVCVNRNKLKKYCIDEKSQPVFVTDNNKQKIELTRVITENQSDNEYFLRIHSEGKQLKEASMHRQFAARFEEWLAIIAKGITAKNGTKRYDKVNQRIGRLKQRYQSIHRLYDIELEKNEKKVCTAMRWKRIETEQVVVNEN